MPCENKQYSIYTNRIYEIQLQDLLTNKTPAVTNNKVKYSCSDITLIFTKERDNLLIEANKLYKKKSRSSSYTE